MRIKIDAKALNDLDKALVKLFGSGAPRVFNQEIRKTENQIASTKAKVDALSNALQGIQRGTQQFKNMVDQLKQANIEIARLESRSRALYQNRASNGQFAPGGGYGAVGNWMMKPLQ